MAARKLGAWHPLAERFPMLGEDELRDMAASIAERGQFVSCRHAPDGTKLDGRNREAACAIAGVEPRWEVYDGDPIAFIVEVNAERRHLTTGQRAMAVAIGLVEAGARRNGRFERGSVSTSRAGSNDDDNWSKQVARAGLVLDHAPELADPVLRAETALDAAHKKAAEVKRRKDRLAKVGDELSALVDSGVIDLAEAERRIADKARIAELPDDLRERVTNGNLDLNEAESLAAQHHERLAQWAEQIRNALGVLSRMAGYPIPDDLAAMLDADNLSVLEATLNALDRKGVSA